MHMLVGTSAVRCKLLISAHMVVKVIRVATARVGVIVPAVIAALRFLGSIPMMRRKRICVHAKHLAVFDV